MLVKNIAEYLDKIISDIEKETKDPNNWKINEASSTNIRVTVRGE